MDFLSFLVVDAGASNFKQLLAINALENVQLYKCLCTIAISVKSYTMIE